MATTIHAKPVVIYTIKGCPWCIKAKTLLNDKHVEYQEIIVKTDDIRNEMIAKSNGATTVPQIFIDDKHIGGYSDLENLNKSGKLDKMLQDGSNDISHKHIDITSEHSLDDPDVLDSELQNSDNDIL